MNQINYQKNNNKKVGKDIQLLRQIRNIFLSKSVLISIFVTLFIMIFYNFMSKITMPFLSIPKEYNNSLFDMLNLLGGGGLTNMSIFAIGISPYITAQIIVQLLSSDVVPVLAKWAKSGEKGRRKIETLSRLLTLPFAILQAYSIVAFFGLSGQNGEGIQFVGPNGESGLNSFYYFFYITLMIAGTYISIFLSDIITKRGVGNGVTIIILIGIVSNLIPNFVTVFTNITNTISNGPLYQMMSFIVYVVFYAGILWTITFVHCSTRKIPIQQTGQSLLKLGDDLPYLPFKLNTGGVIPVIFASSLMTLPLTIGEIVANANPGNGFSEFTKEAFSFTKPAGVIIYCLLIILFTFFYSYVQLNPERISKDFMKSGRFIIGVKIGKTTEKYLNQVLYRINWIGAPFLAIVASLPYIASLVTTNSVGVPIIPSNSALGGTGMIILVSGTLDMWQAIVSTSTASSYTIKRRRIESSQENIKTDLEQGIGLW